MEAFLFASSLKDNLRLGRLLPWLLLGLIALAMGTVWHRLNPDATQLDQYSSVVKIFVLHLLALVSAVYTTAILSQEVEQKTIVYLLTRPVPRWKLLLFRWLSSVLVVTLIGWLGLFMVSFGVFRSGWLSNPLLLGDMKSVLFGAFAYGALFLLVSLLFNRAMIICLIYAFGWELSVPNMPGEIYFASVFSHMQAIAQHPSSQTSDNKLVQAMMGDLGVNTLSPGTSYAVLILLTALCAGLSLMWFSKFEYVPREDAE